jgi:PEGA domain
MKRPRGAAPAMERAPKISRAQPPRAQPLSRAAMFALGFVLAAAGGCAPTGASLRKADAQLVVACPVDDARVYVDERFVGRAAELRARTIGVVHGTLRVEVRADGWFTAYRDVPVAPGARARVDVELRRVPEGEPGG